MTRTTVPGSGYALAATLLAGVFATLAPAATVAGRYLLLGAPLVVVLAGAAVLGADGRTWRPSVAARLLAALAALAALALCLGGQVTPDHPVPVALAALVLATAADAAGLRPGRRATLAVLVGAGGVLLLVVVACLAITPPPVPLAPAGAPGADVAVGALPAAGVLFLGFVGVERTVGRRSLVLLGGWLAGFLVLAAAALHQLGAARLAISSRPLHDALAAADATALSGLVTAAALVATGYGLLVVLGLGRDALAELGAERRAPVAAAVAGAFGLLGVLLLGPDGAAGLAATAALGSAGLAAAHGRGLAGYLALAVAAAVAVTMPPRDVGITAAVVLVAALVPALRRRYLRRP